MKPTINRVSEKDTFPVIDLADAPGARTAWGRPKPVMYIWAACELIFVTNPWQISSRVRIAILRAFGAKIGQGVSFRPRTKVKCPWKLEVGDGSWIGEGVWFHNQDRIVVGANVVISQETFLTTGSHRVRSDMGLITSPITVEDGAWITSRCMILGGSVIGTSALVQPMTLVKGTVPPNAVFGQDRKAEVIGKRFPKADKHE